MNLRRLALLAALLCLAACLATAETLTLTFVGDTSIGDAFPYKNNQNSYHKVVKEKGFTWPFSLVEDVFKGDDLSIANLEGVVTNSSKHRKDVRYPLVIDPSHMEILRQGSIEVVNTANNHAMDFFAKGYQDTVAHLDEAGIHHFGTLSPPSATKIDRQVIVPVKGIQVGFIGYTYPQNSDLARIEKAARGLRDDGCDLIVLSLHWGRETHMTPNSAQYSFAKKVLNYDIDLIFGHHPHVVQPIALYEGRPVLFSTGNFTFGTMSKVDPTTGLFQVEYDLSGEKPRLKALRVIPCFTSGNGDYRPVPVSDPAQRQKIFAKLSFKKPPKGFEALPATFLETGEARFD
ncbi:MAG: CapA family protein [Clostridiales bacterium]|nr:CapA family protein [Clostridiales bacterium]